MPYQRIEIGLLLLLLSACAEGQWVQADRTGAQMQDDWEQCKAEVLAGEEHRKDTLAGGINLSGCMQSKGYHYGESPASAPNTCPPCPDDSARPHAE